MFIVITGLDGSGTSSISNGLHSLDYGSQLVRTPPVEYVFRRDYDKLLCAIHQQHTCYTIYHHVCICRTMSNSIMIIKIIMFIV